jgi:hypothetical protein
MCSLLDESRRSKSPHLISFHFQDIFADPVTILMKIATNLKIKTEKERMQKVESKTVKIQIISIRFH